MKTRAQILILFLVITLAMILLAPRLARAQDATAIPVVVTGYVIVVTTTPTDTPEPTEGPSPTPTATATFEPDVIYELTVEVDGIGQDVAVVYTIDAGQIGILVFLAAIFLLLCFGLVVYLRGG